MPLHEDPMSEVVQPSGTSRPLSLAGAIDYAKLGLDLLWGLSRTPNWLLADAELGTPAGSTCFGINVASMEDLRCDDYIVDKLVAAQIHHVRLAWSSRAPGGFTQRFLDRLLGAGLDVLVVLVPDVEDARRLAYDPDCQRRWQSLIREFLDQYADRVPLVEIGNAPNRPKWSGYSPRSYVAAWQIAAQEISGRSTLLAGPNISDFEPLFNVAYVRNMIRSSGVRPTAQTTNLFVERAVEPEADDPSAMGKVLAPLLRLNLTKKMHILADVSNACGVPQTFSTYACWTYPRLARWTAYPDRKASDYLARYLLIAKAVGQLDRVYWGPMIDSRDGLIDCQNPTYPKIDNVAHYARVRGEIDDFRVNESFRTFGYLTQLLAQCDCRGAISARNGLTEVLLAHTDWDYHVLYCRDRLTFDLRELYSDVLQEATIMAVDGRILEAELHRWRVRESPLVVRWPIGRGPKSDRDTLRKQRPIGGRKVTHNLVQDRYSIGWSRGEWRGVMELPTSLDPEAAEHLVPERLAKAPEQRLLRNKRNRLWTLDTPLCRNGVVVKLSRVTGGRRLSYLFRQSKGRRHWNNAQEMLRRGVNTPRPLAYFERSTFSALRPNYYLAEYIEDAFSVRDVFTAFAQGAQEFKGLDRSDWIDKIASFVGFMHRRKIIHGDLSSGNIMVRWREHEPEFFLIDLGRARLDRLSGFHKDLRRICYKLDWRDRTLFISAYAKAFPAANLSLWKPSLLSYDAKLRIKKRLKGLLKSK